MSVAVRSIERTLAPRRARYAREMDVLIGAALRVMRRKGYAAATVVDVLAEAQLSTRAFYRHFRSKDELFLAVFEKEAMASRERMRGRLEAAPRPLEKLGAWIDEMLTLAYEPRRARRTKTFFCEAAALRAVFPAEFSAIYAELAKALVPILEQGRAEGVFPLAEPEADAALLCAVTWSVVEARFAGGGPPTARAARARLLSFGLRALGADLEDARRRLDF